MTDKWLRPSKLGLGTPWEISRPEIVINVGFRGLTEAYTNQNARSRRSLHSRARRQEGRSSER
jgi:hypothetical protein